MGADWTTISFLEACIKGFTQDTRGNALELAHKLNLFESITPPTLGKFYDRSWASMQVPKYAQIMGKLLDAILLTLGKSFVAPQLWVFMDQGLLKANRMKPPK